MTDARDAVRDAKGANARRAAACIVRRDEAAAAIAELERQRAEAAALLEAAAGRPELEGEAAKILGEIDAQLAERRTELQAAEHDLAQARGELAELDRLAGKAAAADAQAIASSVTGGDPLVRSPEQIALDNVRAHAAELEAQARLGEELSPAAVERELAGAPPAADPAAAPGTEPAPRSMAEEEARRRFEELRARAGKGGPPPKKTL